MHLHRERCIDVERPENLPIFVEFLKHRSLELLLMPLRYFKFDTPVSTCCEHCGTQRLETLARLYSEARLICPACGQEHTKERAGLRQTVEETEEAIANLPAWMERMVLLLDRWRPGSNSANPP